MCFRMETFNGWVSELWNCLLGGGFNFFYVHPDPCGNDSSWRAYFSDGWFNPQPDEIVYQVNTIKQYATMQPCEVGKSYRWPFSSHDLQKAVFVTQSHKRIQFHLAQLVNQAWMCFEVICLPFTKVNPPFGRLVLELVPSTSKSRKSKIKKLPLW